MGQSGEVQLVLKSLHKEANKWRRLADDMSAVKAGADRLDLNLTAFFFADIVSTTAHSQAYNQFQDWMVSLFTGAAAEFDEIATALDKAADLYERTDHGAAVSLTEIYGSR
jgi:hypothetical protein